MKKQAQLTRTCLACGLEKPLAAFLQITGAQGTHYGNICSSCRSAYAKGKAVLPERTEDDTSRGSAGVRIGAKERVQSEIRQKSDIKKSQETHYEELEKREKLTFDKTELSDKQQKKEKKHRESYADDKQKQSFLQYKTKQTVAQTPGQSPITSPAETVTAHQQQAYEAHTLEKSREHESRLSTVDTSQLYLDSQFGELKFQSVVFRQFKEWLGEGANFRVMERLIKAKQVNKTSSKEIKTASDAFKEHEKKAWKPTGRR